MNIIIDIDKFDPNNVFFQTPVRNTIMENSNFVRIIYSTDYYVLSNILLEINFTMNGITKYFDKLRYYFVPDKNKEIIQCIGNLEKQILDRLNISGKTQVLRIHDQLISGNAKFYIEQPLDKAVPSNTESSTFFQRRYILKISGIWETSAPTNEYGLTYKFIEVI